jgi:hypothetical protein
LDELHEALAHCASALASYRTDLIESLGDSLCGLGQGPLPADVERLKHLEKTHDALRRVYGEALDAVSGGSAQRAVRQ